MCRIESARDTDMEYPMLKRNFLKFASTTALSLGVALSALPALAQDVTMNLGFGAPETSIYGRFGTLFKDNLEEMSDGAIEVKLRCCNQISTEDDAFKAMQLGTVDGFIITANNVSPHWPLMDVTVLPYIFQDGDHLLRVLDGEVGQEIKDQLQAETSVHLLAYGPALYRDFYNSVRPINTMADMEGLKIRVPKNEVMIATFEAFGAEPVPLAWSETPTALQTGTVDGGDNGTSFIRDMKFYEFEPHLVILEHFVSMSPLFASDAFMKRLTDEQRQWVLDAADAAGKELREQVENETQEIREWLATEGGMAMTTPDKADFIAAAEKIQNEFAEARGPEFVELVGKIQAAAK
ncbi:TRAP transporter substrate-binding protein [Sulfitobacter alexandrii]|nr:TRAP transporter substrate-binding protein [Sulfitobacter alexandrii]